MKQPKMRDFKKDKKGTDSMREQMAKSKKVKITINFDSELLDEVKEQSEKTGTPYQRLLNQLVRDSLKQKQGERNRIDRLEKEIKELKKKIT